MRLRLRHDAPPFHHRPPNPLERRPRRDALGIANEDIFSRHDAEHHLPAERDAPEDVGRRDLLAEQVRSPGKLQFQRTQHGIVIGIG